MAAILSESKKVSKKKKTMVPGGRSNKRVGTLSLSRTFSIYGSLLKPASCTRDVVSRDLFDVEGADLTHDGYEFRIEDLKHLLNASVAE
jgi:hypothetical protein